MAEKYRESILNLLDLLVYRFYYSGISISFIFHTIVFLFLSLFVISQEEIRTPIILKMPHSLESEPVNEPFPDIDSIQLLSLDDSKECILPESVTHSGEDIVLKEHFSDFTNTHIPYYGFDEALLATDSFILDDIFNKLCSHKLSYAGQIDQILVHREGSSKSQSVSEGDRIIIGEIQDRVKKRGGKTGDVQISLSWNTRDDLDLHATIEPNSNINWTKKRGTCGGRLDIDMNARQKSLTNKPIENIFWPIGKAPKTRYIIMVHLYMNWDQSKEVDARVLVKIDDKLQLIPITVKAGENPKTVIIFNR